LVSIARRQPFKSSLPARRTHATSGKELIANFEDIHRLAHRPNGLFYNYDIALAQAGVGRR
jgi:hypothetical protein